MEVWYIIIVGFLTNFFDMNILREVGTVLKYYEFYLVPLVQIRTSVPLKNFVNR